MSIGTAKPTAEEQAQVPHYFKDSHYITEHLTTTNHEQLSLRHLTTLCQQTNTAVVCGGKGLYIKALTEGIDDIPQVRNAKKPEETKM